MSENNITGKTRRECDIWNQHELSGTGMTVTILSFLQDSITAYLQG